MIRKEEVNKIKLEISTKNAYYNLIKKKYVREIEEFIKSNKYKYCILPVSKEYSEVIVSKAKLKLSDYKALIKAIEDSRRDYKALIVSFELIDVVTEYCRRHNIQIVSIAPTISSNVNRCIFNKLDGKVKNYTKSDKFESHISSIEEMLGNATYTVYFRLE